MTAATGTNQTFVYIHGLGTAASGETSDLNWKAWNHSELGLEQIWWWDASRVGDSLGLGDSEATALNRYLRRIRAKLLDSLALLQLDESA
eukprot:135261-Amphidinium_carterae.1